VEGELNKNPDDPTLLDTFLKTASEVADKLQKRYSTKWVNPDRDK